MKSRWQLMLGKHRLFKLLGWWPPYLGAGIRMVSVAADYSCIEVEMKLRFWNQNYVGTQFGGSMYSMTDPFFMLILMENLGRDYIVWDKAAAIRFKKPGLGRVRAKFEISPDQIAEFKRQADENYKFEPVLKVNLVNDQDETIAEVEKTLYIRRKDRTKKTSG